MDQIEEDEVLIENEAGFGCLGDSRELASKSGETHLFGYRLAEELAGISAYEQKYLQIDAFVKVVPDAAFYNQHQLQLS